MTITSYAIVTAATADELERKVADGGYSPVGGIVTINFAAVQAVGIGSVDVGSATEYTVVQGGSVAELVAKVNEAITNDDLQPFGGVVEWYNALVQVMGNITESGGGGGGGGVTGLETQFVGFDASGDQEAVNLNPMHWNSVPPISAYPENSIWTAAVVHGVGDEYDMGYLLVDEAPEGKALAMRNSDGQLQVAAATEAGQAVNKAQLDARVPERFSVSGSILASGEKLFLQLSGVEVGIEYLSTASLRQYMRAVSGSVTVDYRCMSIWGASAVDAATFDGATVTTSPTMITDLETYDDSNETIINHLRVGSVVWEIGAFLSGNGARCAMWAERKV